MPFQPADREPLLRLLEQMATRDEVAELLRTKGLPFSATNWDTFLAQRLIPALDENRVTLDEVARVLAEAEEHGRQHVLLYRTTRNAATEAINENRVQQRLVQRGLGDLLVNPRILDLPDEPTWVEARVEVTPRGQPRALVLKHVQTREVRTFVSERRSGRTLNVTYKVETSRAVNLIRLHADGFCEVRIQSHRSEIGQRRRNYAHEAGNLLLQVEGIIPVQTLQSIAITTAKNELFNQRHQLANVRFTNSTLKNANGYTLSAAAGSDAGNLFTDQGTADSLETFYEHDGYCDSSNVWFRVGTKPNGQPNWVHVLLSGQENEYALTAQVSVKEYDHALGQLRAFNR